MKKKKVLLVTGDDFGYCQSINNGIFEAYKNGILRNVSLIAAGEGFDHAVQILKQNPGLAAGVHITLVASKPVSDPGNISTLCDTSGYLPVDYFRFAAKLFSGRFKMVDIEKEITAQVELVVNNGITPTHIDSHQHVHILPHVRDIFIQTAKKFSIPFIRIPKEQIDRASVKDYRPVQLLKYALTIPLIDSLKKRVKKSNLQYCKYFHGLMVSGKMSQPRLLNILKNVRPGINELMCHPGYPPPSNDPAHRWGYLWDTEREALTNKETLAFLESETIHICNFNEV